MYLTLVRELFLQSTFSLPSLTRTNALANIVPASLHVSYHFLDIPHISLSSARRSSGFPRSGHPSGHSQQLRKSSGLFLPSPLKLGDIPWSYT